MLTRVLCLLALLFSCSVVAAGDVARGRDLSAPCAACHNADGNSVNAIWPKLAGQHAEYLYRQLTYFKKGANGPRNVPLMYAQAMNLSDTDMADLAAYFESQSVTPATAEAGKVALGEKIYRYGNLETGVTACASCHHPEGKGNGPGLFPRVAGQHATYLAQQLQAFKTGTRIAEKMSPIAKRMTDEEIEAVSSYMAGLKTGTEPVETKEVTKAASSENDTSHSK